MLIKASATRGYSVMATDGPLGTVSDMLFDDATWAVRWLVVDTGTWLNDRRVLIPAAVLGQPDPAVRDIRVRLTMDQVRNSPDVDTQRPVSRQYETGAHDYYGLTPYWTMAPYLGGFGYWEGALPNPPIPAETEVDHHRNDDPNLRSIAAITGYHIHATDGEIGHLADVLVDDRDWSLRYLIVDTSNWWMGKQVLISPRSTRSIRWSEELVNLSVDRDRVKSSPPYDPDQLVDAAHDRDMTRHYGPNA